ncbi:MAG: beta strand repeat-containing protein, partial [Mucilaginibacter sp.]
LTLKDNVKANFAQKLNVDNGSDTAATLILQNFNDNGSIIDFNGTVNNVATLNIQSILGAAATANTNNTATINNTGAKITAINISGDQKATFVLQTGVAGAAKTINASTSTGGVSVDTSADAKASTFAFTGGAGNDTLMLKAGDLTAIAAGGQIDFGAGTNDKIVTLDTTFAAADYAKLNAIKNVEVLGTGAAAAVVDASQLTSIKNFSIDGNGIQAYTKMAAGATVTDTSATHAATLSFGGDVGVNTLNLILGADSKAAGIAIGGNLTIGQTTVSLVSNGDGTATNTISALKNADNSTYTITGSNDLTITATQATAIGSKYDGSAATGKLNITGNTTGFSAGSALGDVIIGGSKADTLKAAVNGGTLTGNGGNDQFDVSAAVTGATAATAAVTTITDFTKGDSIKFTGTASTFVSTKVDTSAAGSLVAAIDAIAASTTANSITWGVYGGNTYVVDNIPTTAGGLTATDVLVKLTGTLDLSTSTVATGTLTFA